jgi:hypothetical protein
MMITHMDSYRTYTRPVFISALMLVSTWDEVRFCYSLLVTQAGSHKLRFLFFLTKRKTFLRFSLLYYYTIPYNVVMNGFTN